MEKPKIRFKGYQEDWEQRKLDDVVEFLDTMRKPLEGAKRISGPYPYYGASGIVDYVDGYLFDEELILLSEDGANITDRNYPVCFLASGKYWVNNHAHVLRTKQENENNFICNSLERKDYTQYNTGMAMPKLNKETCKKIPILCPGFEEQKKIGDYFRSLDNLITLHQRKCEEMKILKKYMLQKMFPQNGQLVPQIRFSGFTEDWEQRKFGDYNDLMTGYPFESDKFSEDGIKLVRGMNVKRGYLDFSEDICVKWNSCVGLENFLLKDGDILIQMDGALIGKSYAKIKENQLPALLVQRVTRARTNNKFASQDFMYQIIQRDFLRYIEMNKTETAVPHLSLNDIRNFEIMVPCLAEQKKIGDYFESLDHLITLHQQKCDELRNIKKFMLQNMFI